MQSLQMFFKIVALKNFVNFTGKHLCRRLFNKVAGPQNSNFIRKRLQNRCFPAKFAKVLRKSFFTEHLQWLLLTISGFQTATLLKKRLRQRCFSLNFAECLRTLFDRTPLDCFLSLPVNSQNTSFIQHLWQTAYFMYELQYFNHQMQ